MHTFESFYRATTLGSQSHTLPAEHYNSMRLLFTASQQTCVFVPLRAMQYMAVIDAHEIIFVDAFNRPYIEFAWQHFKPQLRHSLSAPVQYEWVYYQPNALATRLRAQSEFFRAVQVLQQRLRAQHRPPEASTLVAFKPRFSV